MTAKALIILAEGFEEVEALTPIDILRRAGINVVTAGLDEIFVTGGHGVVIKTDVVLENVKETFDALVLPGGSKGSDNLSRSDLVEKWIKEQHKRGGIIAAICAAPAVVLAKTGILKGKKATCYPGQEKLFGDSVTYIHDANVVIDGNILTSKGVGTSQEFSLVLAERLAGKKTASQVANATLFPVENPFFTG
ncbi:MAG: DJ-1/PfpI family protein [Candidatus Aureabacteria bacterium]|nr:DJ-1/PfpI family protein [Candidatus Auribacterota bacterium]